MDAAQTCPGLPWSVLAGIGTVESDNGQSDLPGVHSGANFAGAEGPMQFEPSTFAEYAAGPDQPLSPYDPADAIYTAAAMLCASGARGGTGTGIENAVFAYNHAGWYVSEVMSWAAKYATQGGSNAVTTAIAFAKAQIGKPYQWGAAGPDAYDCSGLVYAAYAAAGIHIARTTYQWQQDGPVIPLSQIQPGDLLFSAGSDGTPTNPGHVVMYLGNGQVIQAPADRPGRPDRPSSAWPASSSPPARRPSPPRHDPTSPSSGDILMTSTPHPRHCRSRSTPAVSRTGARRSRRRRRPRLGAAPAAGQPTPARDQPAVLRHCVTSASPPAGSPPSRFRRRLTRPASRDFARHVTASASRFLERVETASTACWPSRGIRPLPYPDEPGAALCRPPAT